MTRAVLLPTWLERSVGNENAGIPGWFADFRQQQREAFIQTGIPTRQDERWKYADLSFLTQHQFVSSEQCVEAEQLQDVIHQHRLRQGDSILLVLVNGFFMPSLSDLAKLPPQVIACSMQEALSSHPELIKAHWPQAAETKQYPFASLNAAMCMDGLFFYLPDQCALAAPLHLLSLVINEQEWIACPRHLFILGEHSRLTVAEEHFSLSSHRYLMNMVTTMTIGKHAQLKHIKIQQEGRKAIHLAHTFVTQQQDSEAAFTYFSFGSQFARDELAVKLEGPGAICDTSGFYHLQHDNQYIDHHVEIDHNAAHSQSQMLYKGILDKKSRAVFNGRLYVKQEAKKILAYQANHNLLLSHSAEVYSKPELEIYADDVKCKHGATTGQLDHDALFYMRARGIDKAEAIAILLRGFAEEITQRITHPGIKMRVQEML
ncbi:Fe-S cluster assembly protein SufD [Aquicella lusitana]|uniref:Iron-regulated ABC transporter permease protein SufD n=1 Tax=Aquicella lusitana TaxID=254246 RepID=A0A370GDN3_9COXI|nr:Fe-S cluster assembly protein SufD [Aquicella lusitana]RDI41340.1 iron-regulated ABC transporter permease protein SufD [Aquicella lusitana]VVC72294.1 FeS cluster assembly protein SufD [Aquicella lusitana]